MIGLRSTRLLAVVVALVVAASTLAAIVLSAPANSARVKPAKRANDTSAYAPVRFQARNAARVPAAQQALPTVLRGLDASAFVSADLGAAPTSDDWQGRWFYATVRAPSVSNAGALFNTWQAELAQGALAEVMDVNEPDLANVIVGSTIQAQLPDGTTAVVGGGAGDIAAGQQFRFPADDAHAVGQARKIVKQFGLRPGSVRVLHADGAALAVTATVASRHQLAGIVGRLKDALLGSPARYVGLYLELRDSSGAPLVKVAVALRTGVGTFWTRPGFTEDVGIAHG